MGVNGGRIITLDGFGARFSTKAIWLGRHEIEEIHVYSDRIELWGTWIFLGGTWGGRKVKASGSIYDAPRHIKELAQSKQRELQQAQW